MSADSARPVSSHAVGRDDNGEVATFGEVLRTPRFVPLFVAAALSGWGDYIARIAMAAVVYDRTGSAMTTGLTLAVSMVPSIFGRSLLGPLVDRLAARMVLVIAHLVRAALVAGLVVAVSAQAPIWSLLLILFVTECVGGVAPGASIVILTVLFPKRRRYAKAVALNSLAEQLNQVVGFGLGGALIALLGPGLALSVDLATFVLAALAVAIWAPAAAPAEVGQPAGLRAFARDVADGWRYLRRHPVLAPMVWLGVFAATAMAAPEAAGIPLAGGAAVGGLLMASLMAGAFLGLLIVSRWPVERANAWMLPMAVAMPGPLLVTALGPPLPVLVGLWLISGMLQAFMLPLQATFTLALPERMRGRIFGLAGAAALGATGLSLLITGWLGEHVGPGVAVTLVAAASWLAIGVVALRWPQQALGDMVRHTYGADAASSDPDGQP